MVSIEVNGKPIEAREGEMLLDALERAGIKVPTLCHMKDLFPSGACRMCVVEIDGSGPLVPSCAFPVREGLRVKTHSDRAVEARKTIIELLLSNHPDDCLYCVRNNDCQLQSLAAQLGVEERRFDGARGKSKLDTSSLSIVRDPDKCILCGRCVRMCEEVQDVACIDFVGRGSKARVGTAFEQGLNVSSCINCGQCIMVCPTGALTERSHIREVQAALADPEMTVVVQHAPAVSVSLAESLGLPAGGDVAGTMTTALHRLGFDHVFSTSFSADLTIMEEATELVQRITAGGPLPMMTSCSPGWIKYVETFHHGMIPNLSTCKSPQQMLGAMIKSYWAEKKGIDPEKIFSVAVMPCVAKKFEAARPEMLNGARADVDAVLTTRELAKLIRSHGLDLSSLDPTPADDPFGERSSAGKLFGATGGVMEAAIRTAYHLLTGKELEHLEVEAVRGLDGVKKAELDVDGTTVRVAVVSGLGNAAKLLEEIAAGREELHFVEVMTCPGGCINGGGQPFSASPDAVRRRMEALYAIDGASSLRLSHENPSIRRLYEEYLGEPAGERSHALLHTHYEARDLVR